MWQALAVKLRDAVLMTTGLAVVLLPGCGSSGHTTGSSTPTVTTTGASGAAGVSPSVVKAASAYYLGNGLVNGSEVVECEFYGISNRVLAGHGVDGSEFIPQGTNVYDCAPEGDTSISGCFAIVNGIAYNEDLSQPETCSDTEPAPSSQGKYLPPTDDNISRLVEDEFNLTLKDNEQPAADFTGVTFSIGPLTSTDQLPSDEIDTDLSHWFVVQFMLAGSTYTEVADPWTHEVYESSLSS
jgi:hypothetical protein